MTQFAAMTNEEYREKILIKHEIVGAKEYYTPEVNLSLPTSVNW